MIVENINKYLKFKSLSVSSAEKKIGFSNGTLSKPIKEGNNIKTNTLEKFLSYFEDLNPNWLITGVGEMLVEDEIKRRESYGENNAKIIPNDEFMYVPAVINYAKAGYLAGFEDPEFIDSLPKVVVPKEYEPGNYKIFEVDGDSMDDGKDRSLKDQDKYLAKELPREYWTHKLQINKYLFIVLTRKGMVFKQIVDHKVKDGIIKCHSFNDSPEYKDYEVNLKTDVSQLFYVKKLIERKLKF
jgi:hypothetical protein